MLSECMKTDLVRQIDLEGLLLNKAEAVDGAEQISKTIEDNLALIENEISFSRFVQAHLSEIKENQKIMFEIDRLAVELLNDKALLIPESTEVKNALDKYVDFFDQDNDSVKNINICCGDYPASLPDNPYPSVISDIRNQIRTCFNSSEVRELEEMSDVAARDELIAKDIARIAGNLIKYDIHNEYPEFCSGNLPPLELLLKDSSVTADATVSEIDELLEALTDCKNQLECAKSLMTE